MMAAMDELTAGTEPVATGEYVVVRCTCPPGADLAAAHGTDQAGGLLPCPAGRPEPARPMEVQVLRP